jgi:hypothetical protein
MQAVKGGERQGSQVQRFQRAGDSYILARQVQRPQRLQQSFGDDPVSWVAQDFSLEALDFRMPFLPLFLFWTDCLCFEEFIEQRPVINHSLP